MPGLDETVFRWVNRWPDELEPVFVALSEGNKWTSVRVGLTALFLSLVLRPSTRAAALLAIVAWPIANALTDALKAAWRWPRPSAPVAALVESGAGLEEAKAAVPDLVLRVEPLGSFGTASAHSANMMAVAVVFLLLTGGWLRWAWLSVAVLTGLSRLYVGVHYPSQVLLGWLCGAATGLVVAKTWQASLRLRAGRSLPEAPPAGGP